MKLLLFDRNENYISTLKDVIDARHTEEINGENILDITTLDKLVEKDYRLAYKCKLGYWHEFIIKEIRESHTSGGIEKKLFCESSFYETLGDYVEDKRPNGGASTALLSALETTRWEAGRVDNLGEGATNFYHISAKESVQKAAEVWKGEIQTRVEIAGNKITHRYVELLAKRGGDFGKRFTYTKDLESVTKIVHRDDVITALYGYGKGEQVGDGFGRRIDFSKINNDKAYVENLDALNIWGRNNPDGTKSHVFGKVEFDECEDEVELLALTEEKLEELSEPLITYECSVIDLGGAELGDRVRVVDKEFEPELRLNARVVKIVRDLLSPEKNNITLGNFIPSIEDIINGQESFINNFRSKQGIWDRSNIIDKDGTINAQFLNNLVDEINTKMNSQGGYVFISEDGQGLITTNKPTIEESTEAIQLVGGGFRIANSKNPDGTFNWRTFGTGNGFVADEITAGILRSASGESYFDLNNNKLVANNADIRGTVTSQNSSDGVYSRLGLGKLEFFNILNGLLAGRVWTGYANNRYSMNISAAYDSEGLFFNRLNPTNTSADKTGYRIIFGDINKHTMFGDFDVTGNANIGGHIDKVGNVNLRTNCSVKFGAYNLKIIDNGSDLHLQNEIGSVNVQASSLKVWNYGFTAWAPVDASAFNVSSLEKYKTNIVELSNALEIIDSSKIYEFNLKDDIDNDIDKKNYGFVIGDSYGTPKEVMSSSNESINQYSMVSVLWKAVQELSEKVDGLQAEMDNFKK